MKTILSIAATIVLAATLPAAPAHARAGTLVKCDMITTQQGIKYVGIYCADFECRYTITRLFDSYCPFVLP